MPTPESRIKRREISSSPCTCASGGPRQLPANPLRNSWPWHRGFRVQLQGVLRLHRLEDGLGDLRNHCAATAPALLASGVPRLAGAAEGRRQGREGDRAIACRADAADHACECTRVRAHVRGRASSLCCCQLPADAKATKRGWSTYVPRMPHATHVPLAASANTSQGKLVPSLALGATEQHERRPASDAHGLSTVVVAALTRLIQVGL